jgi:TatD DNase family protein
MIDSHIHLDLYEQDARERILSELQDSGVEKVIAVSLHLASCKMNRSLYLANPNLVLPAYGFHPERLLPTDADLTELFNWIDKHKQEMVAVGEVGLPYYMRQEAEAKGEAFDLQPYVELLEKFVQLAARLEKPIVLHAVYEDAEIACDLLEKYNVKWAHFHWFKGSEKTVERMMRNGYYVSFTPDIAYEEEIQALAKQVPLNQMMVETDGPWPFEGPFAGQMTHPRMIYSVVEHLTAIKRLTVQETIEHVRRNTRVLYGLST